MDEEVDLEYRIKRKTRAERAWESETSPRNVLRLPLPCAEPRPTQEVAAAAQARQLCPRQLYVGNLPALVVEAELSAFLFAAMQASGGLLAPGNPILAAEHNPARAFVLLELRSFEETSSLLCLRGLLYKDNALTLRRPFAYAFGPRLVGAAAPAAPMLSRVRLRRFKENLAQFRDALLVANLPFELEEEFVFAALSGFGRLAGFDFRRAQLDGEWVSFALVLFEEEDAGLRAVAAKTIVGDRVANVVSLSRVGLGEERLLQRARPYLRDRFVTIGDKVVALDTDSGPQSRFLASYTMLRGVRPGAARSKDIQSAFARFGAVSVVVAAVEAPEGRAHAVFVEFAEEKHALAAKLYFADESYFGNALELRFYDAALALRSEYVYTA